MATSIAIAIEQDENMLPEAILDDLVFVARGDVDLVELAIIDSLKVERYGWFWFKKRWTVDMVNVVKTIIARRDAIDNIEIEDAESQINNG
jgi:hypothetical protein